MRRDSALAVSRAALKLLLGVALLYALGLAVLLVSTIVAEEPVFRALGVKTIPGSGTLMAGMRTIMLLGIASVPLAIALLSQLLAITYTVRLGDPFIADNARRLRLIAWCLLGLQVLNVLVALIAASVSTEENPIHIGWPTDVTGWLAVLLLFVLAQVFEHGARMRDDLAGTV